MLPSRFIIDSPPLLIVLAKIQFGTILKIPHLIPDFQEAVRTKGFPIYRQKDVRQLKFTTAGAPPQEENQRFWQFINPETTEVLSLAPDFLTITASNYISFKQFSHSLDIALSAIADVIKPSTTVGLGFRCVNAIESPNDSQDGLWDFINPGLHGIDAKTLGTSHFHHEYQYWTETQEGHLIIQCKYVHGKDAIPPDLRAEQLAMRRKLDAQRCVFGIQIDHNTFRKPKSDPFNPSEIHSALDKLHETANRGFLACVTQKALTTWGFHLLPS